MDWPSINLPGSNPWTLPAVFVDIYFKSNIICQHILVKNGYQSNVWSLVGGWMDGWVDGWMDIIVVCWKIKNSERNSSLHRYSSPDLPLIHTYYIMLVLTNCSWYEQWCIWRNYYHNALVALNAPWKSPWPRTTTFLDDSEANDGTEPGESKTPIWIRQQVVPKVGFMAFPFPLH